MQNKSKKKWKILVLIIFAFLLSALLLTILFYHISIWGYSQKKIGLESAIKDSLAIFLYNESQHNDAIPNCWYDSGDYIVFLHRNAETLFYLSLAYRESTDEAVRKDLLSVIRPQLRCAEKMLTQNKKQFRDQDSHGVNVPPKWNEVFFPNRVYRFREEEGKDVFLLLALTHKNLGDEKKAEQHLQQAKGLKKTTSENCCEWGPLFLTDEEVRSLEILTDEYGTLPNEIWGIQLTSLAALENDRYDMVTGVLEFVEQEWDSGKNPFVYIGGNYDIAGTIALERLYAKKTGDSRFLALSTKLHDYLNGKNKYTYDFDDPEYVYHPCGFFDVCNLKKTLINGIHDPDQQEVDRSWQTSEVQLVGQAQYVLSRILWENTKKE